MFRSRMRNVKKLRSEIDKFLVATKRRKEYHDRIWKNYGRLIINTSLASTSLTMSGPNDTVISIENPKYFSLKESQRAEINILCINLTPFSRLTQFFICTIFVFAFYLAYGYFLELIFTNKEAKVYNLYITLIQFIMTMGFAYVEFLMRIKMMRKVPIITYAILAGLTLGTMVFSNMALSYLNYPTQLIFKSCKLIPVMIGSIIILGKRYGFIDYMAAIIMCIGLTMFTLADSNTSPRFDFIGVIIISLALLCDAVIGNVQEKAMKQYQASNNEVVFYSYAIASIYLTIINAANGTLLDGYAYCSESPLKMYSNIFLMSLSGYMGLQAVLTLVRICGATVAVTVTTMRKALSICVSFLLFSKPFTFQYLWSGLLVALAVYLNHYSKKHPQYVPMPLLRLWHCLKTMYNHELNHIIMRTQSKKTMYTDSV